MAMNHPRPVEAILAAEQAELRAYARHLVRSAAEAEDVVQDACVEVLSRPELLQRGDNPAAYLRGIVRHLASRCRSRIERSQPMEDFIDAAWETAQRDAPDADAEVQRLRRCMEQLAPRARALIAQRYEHDADADAIARQHGMTIGGVRMALLRARQTLAACLGRQVGVRV